jgi:nucleotide-binding universal stress UspA family protein
MPHFRSILLPTDFAQASLEAAKVAAQIAKKFNSRVNLLHVLEPMPQWPVALHELRETADAVLKGAAQRLIDQDIQVGDVSVITGRPAETILAAADRTQADLILCGAGTLSPFGRYSAGPTAFAIIEQSKIPVLAVPPTEAPPLFRKVLCPVDHSNASARGLEYAGSLAREYACELIVLSVVPAVSYLVAAAESRQFEDARLLYDARWREEFKAFLQSHPLTAVHATTEVRAGRPHEQIIAAAKEHQCDVIVVGATGRSGLPRVLLGSTTRRLLTDIPCSLLTVKPDWPENGSM